MMVLFQTEGIANIGNAVKVTHMFSEHAPCGLSPMRNFYVTANIVLQSLGIIKELLAIRRNQNDNLPWSGYWMWTAGQHH